MNAASSWKLNVMLVANDESRKTPRKRKGSDATPSTFAHLVNTW